MNQCGMCHEDFANVKCFDQHRVGVHEYTYTEGLHMEPMREDGRRCMSVDKMKEKLGFTRNAKGRWYDPVRRERTEEYFQAAAGSP